MAGKTWAVEPYEIVTNSGVSEKTLSKSSLRAIFGMRLHTWPDGSPIHVFVLPDDAPLHIAFSKEKLNVFPYQLRAAWTGWCSRGRDRRLKRSLPQRRCLQKWVAHPEQLAI